MCGDHVGGNPAVTVPGGKRGVPFCSPVALACSRAGALAA